VSDDFNSSNAKMELHEGVMLVAKQIDVNLGKNGLGFGIGIVNLLHKGDAPVKYEGDNKSPIGIFRLSSIFGYGQNIGYKMPYLQASSELICVDDSNSKFYNQIMNAHGDEKSFEYMRREDNQYKFGVVVEHNVHGIARRGSCIFMHIQKGEKRATSGCTSMKEEEIKKILNWLDSEKKPILIQIPKRYAREILTLYPELKNSELLE
jgi:L,D-peptidoglycan transpeptidase YkuD (ErfK/YbiS/YcfS/YnhG family)